MSLQMRMELSFAGHEFSNQDAGTLMGKMVEVLLKNNLLPQEIVTYAVRIEQVIRQDRRQWVPDDDMEPWPVVARRSGHVISQSASHPPSIF